MKLYTGVILTAHCNLFLIILNMHDSRQVAEANGLADAMGLGGFPPPTPPQHVHGSCEYWDLKKLEKGIEDTNQGILKAAREHDLAGTAQRGQRALNRTCAWIPATSQRSVFSFGVRVLVLVLCQLIFFILL